MGTTRATNYMNFQVPMVTWYPLCMRLTTRRSTSKVDSHLETEASLSRAHLSKKLSHPFVSSRTKYELTSSLRNICQQHWRGRNLSANWLFDLVQLQEIYHWYRIMKRKASTVEELHGNTRWFWERWRRKRLANFMHWKRKTFESCLCSWKPPRNSRFRQRMKF